MVSSPPHDPQLAQTLVLDELFDLSLYKALRGVTQPDVRMTLDELIKVETSHLAFWQKFFELKLETLDLGRRVKLAVMMLVCRLFGSTAVHLVLEAIEVHGVRKYLALWREYQGQPLGEALHGILMDEFKHEDVLVTELTKRKINAEKIRNIFLGLNDGLVEILGAVSGFFGAFGSATMVLVAASTTAVAGALSMAAGAFLALNSEKEVKTTEIARKIFLGEESEILPMEESPLGSAFVVGAAYIAGALVPVVPVLLGANDAIFSVVTAGLMVIVVSTILSFLSGMDIKRRIALNLIIITMAVSVTYAIGLAAKHLWGIAV
ncbi:MAG TPA: VIT1/CCC1 transporter family protein [Nitrospiraceae bacterium]|nr:VIT1/CCC1 transporter family protein [Nitrospiraceae bacterium]